MAIDKDGGYFLEIYVDLYVTDFHDDFLRLGSMCYDGDSYHFHHILRATEVDKRWTVEYLVSEAVCNQMKDIMKVVPPERDYDAFKAYKDCQMILAWVDKMK